MLHHLRQRWFLVALLAVLAAGMIWPDTFSPVTKAIPRSALVAAVMFLMALPMETGAMCQSVRRPGPAWLGCAVNAGLAPLLGWLAAHALTGDLAIGLIVVTVVPCTLAGATVWTRRAGGNDAVAILVTTITNLACFLVAPAWLKLLIGAEVEINYVDLLWELMLLVAVPIVAAQIFRQWRPLGAAATRHKLALSELAQIGILVMILIGAVGCGEKIHGLSDREELSAYHLTVMVLAVAAIHLTLLAFGLAAARGLGMSRPDGIAVGIAGSQKTIMAGLFIALQFGPLAILPMVAYHAVQLLLDTLIADWLRGKAPAETGRVAAGPAGAGLAEEIDVG